MKEIREASTAFMLVELETTKEFYIRAVQGGDERVNFFIIFTSGLIGGVALLFQLNTNLPFALITLIALGVIFLLGILTYVRLVLRTLTIAKYARVMTRIRRYFTDHDKELTEYLLLPIHEDQVPYVRGKFLNPLGAGLRGTMAIINSIIAVLLFLALSFYFNLIKLQSVPALISVFLVSYLAHESYAWLLFNKRMQEVKKDYIFFSKDYSDIKTKENNPRI